MIALNYIYVILGIKMEFLSVFLVDNCNFCGITVGIGPYEWSVVMFRLVEEAFLILT
jgi:hypothetical protein